jgi:hypothetical protein
MVVVRLLVNCNLVPQLTNPNEILTIVQRVFPWLH